MRILKVVQAYYPFQDKGGPVFKVRSLARRLAERGHSITVLTADLGLGETRAFHSAFERCRWGWRLGEDGVETIYLPTVARYRALTLNRRLVGFCRAKLRYFDIVHFYGLYDLLGPTAGYFCRRLKVPYLIEPMGMFRPIDRALQLKRLWHEKLGRPFFRGAVRLVATSALEKKELLDGGMPQEKIVVRYNGVDSELRKFTTRRGMFRKQWRIPPDAPLILFLSRLIPRKGADILIEAFAEACPGSARLVIAGPEGESEYRSYLVECARRAGVDDRVTFTGPLYDEEKKAALLDSDIFALPSRYENFANVVAEAVANDLPVLISDSCGIHPLVKGRAGAVVAAEKNSVVCGLREMLHDKALYQRMKDGCRHVADQLDWRQLSAQMEDHYIGAIKP